MSVEVIVFLGSTLASEEAKKYFPEACYQPPIQAGDILKLLFLRPKYILIIDGLFNQSASVKHKEILTAVSYGVVVCGASSMGALRAAELDQYGMVGSGNIYKLYKNAVITGDDEVAISYQVDSSINSATLPIINVRFTLDHAINMGVLSYDQSKEIISKLKEIPYYKRNTEKVRKICDQYNVSDWFFENYIDQKKLDAIGLLTNFREANKALSDKQFYCTENIYLCKIYRYVTSMPFIIDGLAVSKTVKLAIDKQKRNPLLSVIARLLNLLFDSSEKNSEYTKEVCISSYQDEKFFTYFNAYYMYTRSNKLELELIACLFNALLKKQSKIEVTTYANKKLISSIKNKYALQTMQALSDWFTKNKLEANLDDFLEKMSIFYFVIEEGNAHYLNIVCKNFDIYWLEQAYLFCYS